MIIFPIEGLKDGQMDNPKTQTPKPSTVKESFSFSQSQSKADEIFLQNLLNQI